MDVADGRWPVSTWRMARLIAAKDLRIEVRSRVLTNQVAPFALIVMVMFAFALDDEAILPRVAPGLVWLAALFSLLIVVSRSFAVETADGALDQLRASGVPMVGVFLGKSVALLVQLLLLVALVVMSALILYRAEVTVAGGVLLVTTGITATCGLAAIGTLYGGLAAGSRGRETLLPLLLLPVTASRRRTSVIDSLRSLVIVCSVIAAVSRPVEGRRPEPRQR